MLPHDLGRSFSYPRCHCYRPGYSVCGQRAGQGRAHPGREPIVSILLMLFVRIAGPTAQLLRGVAPGLGARHPAAAHLQHLRLSADAIDRPMRTPAIRVDLLRYPPEPSIDIVGCAILEMTAPQRPHRCGRARASKEIVGALPAEHSTDLRLRVSAEPGENADRVTELVLAKPPRSGAASRAHLRSRRTRRRCRWRRRLRPTKCRMKSRAGRRTEVREAARDRCRTWRRRLTIPTVQIRMKTSYLVPRVMRLSCFV